MPRKITNPDNDLSKFLPFFDSVFFHLSNCTQITKQIEIKEFKDSASKKDYIWALTCKYGGKCETTKRADAAADARAARLPADGQIQRRRPADGYQRCARLLENRGGQARNRVDALLAGIPCICPGGVASGRVARGSSTRRITS